MSMRARLRAGVAIASVIPLLSACGGGGGSSSTNTAPIADAGAPQTAFKNAVVALDGSASSDGDNDVLGYHWTQVGGPAVTLSDPDSAQPTFNAPSVSGMLTFRLTVDDGKTDSAPATSVVMVQNRAPSAVAGMNVATGTGSIVTLDGNASTDADGDALVQSWVQKSGPAVVLTNNPNGTAHFTTPYVSAILEFTLNVDDGEAVSSDDVVIVVQLDGGNQPPVADAGSDETVPRRSFVQLYGWGYDPDYYGVTYAWRQTAGPAVTLDDPSSPYPFFTAPASAGDLEFELTVSNGAIASAPDSVTIHVRNFAPVITGLALTPDAPGTLDDLQVTATVEDPDQDPVTLVYQWSKNGNVLSDQTAAVLPESQHVKNDQIVVVVTASDTIETASAEESVVIHDTPAVLTGTPPAEVAHGDVFTFVVSADDPDGDATGSGFEVDYGPAGMDVDDSGVVTWTADDPMFDRAMDFNWRITVSGQASAGLAGTVTVNDPDRQYPLRRTGVQIPVYHSGMVVADLDDDGDSEMLIGSRGSVYELSRVGSGYAPTWVYPFQAGVAAVAAADVDGDGPMEIFYATGKSVVKLDGVARREVARSDATLSVYCGDLEPGDIDGDGSMELVCLGPLAQYGSQYSLVVFDAGTLAIEWQSASLTLGSTMALGNVDGDAALEIVTASGFVFDGATLANQWTYGPGFGRYVDTGDLDGNGIEEIVGVQDWSVVRGFDAVLKSPIWERSGFDFDAVLVANIDGDPAAELLVGDGQWGNVTAYNYVTATNTLSQAWQINSQNHGVTTIGVGDVDGDGALEFVWGSGATSSGEDSFVVAGLDPTIQVEWTNVNPNELDGQFFGARLAAIGAGEHRVVFGTGSTNSGYDGTRLLALDYATGLIEPSIEVGSNWAGGGALDVADYDQDGVDEVLLTTASLYDGYFATFDLGADAVEWTSPQDIGVGKAVTHGDMNGDGHEDMVVLTHDGHVHIFDVHNEALLWTSTGSAGGSGDVAVADLDGDGTLEVIATLDGRVVVYRKTAGPLGYIEAGSHALSAPRDLVVADTNGDGAPEIIVLSNYPGISADVVHLDADLNLLGTFDLPETVFSMHIEELAGTHRNLVLGVSTGSAYSGAPNYLAGVDVETGATVWRSPPLPASPSLNSLSYIDADGDGDLEIAFATADAMYVTR